MRKTALLLTTLFTLGLSLCYSQVSVGILTGLNFAKLSGDAPDFVTYKSNTGFNLGANADFTLSNTVSLSFQPMYSQEGAKLNYSLPGAEESVDSVSIRLNYFALPVVVKIKATNPKFYALAGFETAYLLNSYAKTDDVKSDINSPIVDLNFAMHFGAGYYITPNLFLELRYSQGAVNLTDQPLQDDLLPRVKTSGLKLFFGYQFPLSKN